MIYHLAVESEWNAQLNDADYAPAAFAKEGFIHASHLHQINPVYKRYYAGRTDLLVLHIDERRLKSPLVEEASTAGELFPHIYGKLNKDSIVEITRVNSDRSIL